MIKRVLISAFFVLLMLGTPAFANEEIIEVTADQLLADYLNNELAADQKYKGKLLLVGGEVDRIANDITGKPYVTLKGKDLVRRVQCTFPETMIEKLTKLNKGDTVRFRGKCKGLMGNVLLTFVEKPADSEK